MNEMNVMIEGSDGNVKILYRLVYYYTSKVMRSDNLVKGNRLELFLVLSINAKK